MKRVSREAISFPANPFVALADFVIVLLVILILTVVEQSLSSSSLVERAALNNNARNLKQRLDTDKTLATAPTLEVKGQRVHAFEEFKLDGDIQRFRLHGQYAFAFDRSNTAQDRLQHPPQLNPAGRRLVYSFGQQLARLQGNPNDNGSRPFKRIVIAGHASGSECNGDSQAVWELSAQRAQLALSIFTNDCKIHPSLVEVSAFGSYDPAIDYNVPDEGRSLDIIVLYSANASLRYLRSHTEPVSSPSGGR